MSYKYLCEKPLMSYKKRISVWKTSRCHVKIRYLWGKQVDVIQKYDIYGENKSMSYENTIYMGKTIDVLKDIYRKNHWCHIKIRYICEKQVDVIEKYDIYGQNHWDHIKYDIYGKNHRFYIKTRYPWEKSLMSYKYLCEKPLMSYKNTISMWKTSRCHVKIRHLWGKQVDVIQKYDIYGENKSMSYKNTIYMGKTIDVLKDIYGKNHWCHIKIRYLREKPWMSAKNTISMGKTIDAREIYNISVKNHWCLIRYLWEKPLMSYTNTISIGKTSTCHIKIRYIYGQNHWWLKRYLWENPLMS